MPSPFDKISLRITGGSHEAALGMTLGGIPVGLKTDVAELQKFLDRRKSGKYAFSTPRRENDLIEIKSGIVDGIIDGEIHAVINNENTRPSDYGYSTTPRPSHADYVATVKYGSAPSGGGAFSGRMTAPLCIAGGIAKQILSSYGISVLAYISEIAGLECFSYDKGTPNAQLIAECHDYEYPTPNRDVLPSIDAELRKIALNGDTAGGAIECVVYGLPVGLGGAMSDGLEGKIAMALFAIPAVKAVESGLGKAICRLTGTVANDPFVMRDGKVRTVTNNSGGINGGISNGMPLTVRASFRPTPSVAVEQRTVDLAKGADATLTIKGRHDVAFLPRAVAPVESAVALVILDEMLKNEIIH